MLLYICQYFIFHRCPILYSYICGSNMHLVHVNIKTSWRTIFGIPNMHLPTCQHLGINKSFSVYAYIRVPKNAALYMPTLHLAKMPLSICLYVYLKRCTSVYAYVSVSIYVYIHMPTLCFTKRNVSKRIYVFLKKAPLFIPLSGSLRMLLYIYLYMSFQRYLYLYAYIWFPNGQISKYPHISISKCASLYSILQFP